MQKKSSQRIYWRKIVEEISCLVLRSQNRGEQIVCQVPDGCHNPAVISVYVQITLYPFELILKCFSAYNSKK